MTLSPSQFSQVQECAYRFVLKQQGAAALPSGSAAALGNILHRLMQEHCWRPFANTEEFENAWQRQVVQQEQHLSSNVLTAALVPLARTARGYAVKKAILRRNLLSQLQPLSLRSARTDTAKSYLGTEVKLGGTGYIVGRADLIRPTTDGVELVDYKSGHFTADDLDDEGKVVAKPEYVQQLHLYAALYYAEVGHWPSRLLLVGLNGDEFVVPFLPTECLALLAEAQSLAATLEAVALSGNGERLARPGATVCRQCSYRPHCASYLELIKAAEGYLGSDVTGVITAIMQRGSRLIITLTTAAGPLSVQALGATAVRLHTATPVEVGAEIIIFGVHSTPVNRTFTAEPTAVVAAIKSIQ